MLTHKSVYINPAPAGGSDRDTSASVFRPDLCAPPTIQVHKCPEPHHGRLHATSKLTAGFGAEYPK